jgi:hypothetical protein
VKNKAMQPILDERPTQHAEADQQEILAPGKIFSGCNYNQAGNECSVKVRGR